MSTKMDTEQSLIDELREYCAEQGLPHESADDILALHSLSVAQRAWLTDFCDRWDRAISKSTAS